MRNPAKSMPGTCPTNGISPMAIKSISQSKPSLAAARARRRSSSSIPASSFMSCSLFTAHRLLLTAHSFREFLLCLFDQQELLGIRGDDLVFGVGGDDLDRDVFH